MIRLSRSYTLLHILLRRQVFLSQGAKIESAPTVPSLEVRKLRSLPLQLLRQRAMLLLYHQQLLRTARQLESSLLDSKRLCHDSLSI